jgi:endogenous inhibitor of DNA gyrase (YacG/DUF329 family)
MVKYPGEINKLDGDCPECGWELRRLGEFKDLGDVGEEWVKWKVYCPICGYETDWQTEEPEDLEAEANSNFMAEAI